jgi:hypothetical protein
MKKETLITKFPSTKVGVIDFVQQTKNVILSGSENPIKIAIQLKSLEEIVKLLRTDNEVQDLILDQALKEGEKTFSIYGAEISIREMGTKYDYSICNDSLLGGLYGEMHVLKKKIKDRETMLKTISEDNPAVSMDAEILHPPLKTSKTGLAITLK